MYEPLTPAAAEPGGPGFALTIHGVGFVAASVVNWNGSSRPTTFFSDTQLTAAIAATDIATAGTARVTVSSPGTVPSNAVFFHVTNPEPSISFTFPDNYPTGGKPSTMLAEDFSGDGRVDLVDAVAGLGALHAISVLMSNGDGTFELRPQYSLGTASSLEFASGDFNGDGKLDLAVTSSTGKLAILLGNGDGTLDEGAVYLLRQGTVHYVVAADFNRDGKVDLAVSGGPYFFWVFLGSGDGTFPTVLESRPGVSLGRLVTGDFDGDGILDLADSANLLFGNGSGAFSLPQSYGPVGAEIVAADFNGDGKLDIATATSDANQIPSVSILLGNGDGTFQPPATFPISGITTNQVVIRVGDSNGDGKLDLFLGYYGNLVPQGKFSLLFGNGNGTFQTATNFDAGTSTTTAWLTLGDFDGDGKLDLAAANNSSDPSVIVILQPSPVDVFPRRLTFNRQPVATISRPQTVTLTNHLSTALTLSGLAFVGDDASDFTESHDCPFSPSTLASGASCTIAVTFMPDTAGPKTAALSITDNAPGGSQHLVPVRSIDPAAILQPTSLDFGNQNLTTRSAEQTATLSNAGVGPLTVTGVLWTGDFTLRHDCGVVAAEGGQCTFRVTFYPTTIGTQTTSVFIADNAADSPQTIGLTGTGVPATMTLVPTSLTFGSYNLGTTSPPQTVTVTNSGVGLMGVYSVWATGDFSVATQNCPSARILSPGDSCTISVAFSPTVGGTRSGTLYLQSNAAGSPQTVDLAGTGIAPTMTVSPTSLDFGHQEVGTTSAPKLVTVANLGPGPMTVSIFVSRPDDRLMQPPFAYTTTCPRSDTLAALASCMIAVTFHPTVEGPAAERLSVSSDAVNSPHTVALTGNGGIAPLALVPASLDFGNQLVNTTSAARALTLTNSGPATVDIFSIAIRGANAGDFGETHTCGATLASGGSCTINVTFTPTSTDAKIAEVSVTSYDIGSPHTASLTGSGVGSAVTLSPTGLAFGDQLVGTTSAARAVTLTNNGTATLNISSFAITGTNVGDFAETHTCGTTLAAGWSCTINVTFTPMSAGAKSAQVAVASDASGSPHAVSLTGAGVSSAVTLSPTSLAFSNQLVGTTSAARTVTLSSSGTGTVSISSIAITGTNVGDFAETHTCGATLAAGAHCTINVTFKPTETGARGALASVASDASGSPHRVGLTGTGTDFALDVASSSSASATVDAGQTATYALDISPAGFVGTVGLMCAWVGSQPRGASCTLAPTSVDLDGTHAATVTINAGTTVRSQTPSTPLPRRGPLGLYGRPLLWLLLSLFIASVGFGLPARRRRGYGLAVAVLAIGLYVSCGGGGGGGSAPPPPAQTGTPAGTYSVTVSATASGVTRSTTLTLKVN